MFQSTHELYPTPIWHPSLTLISSAIAKYFFNNTQVGSVYHGAKITMAASEATKAMLTKNPNNIFEVQ